MKVDGRKTGEEYMKCIEARRMVSPFVDKKLTDKETEQFLKHIEHCSDCMDELDIYFTMYKAMDTLDSGLHHEYDFKKMLENEIRSVRYGIMRRKIVRASRSIILVLAEILLLVSVYTGYQMKQGEIMDNVFRKAIIHLQMRTEKLEQLPDKTEELLKKEMFEQKSGRGNKKETQFPTEYTEKTDEVINDKNE